MWPSDRLDHVLALAAGSFQCVCPHLPSRPSVLTRLHADTARSIEVSNYCYGLKTSTIEGLEDDGWEDGQLSFIPSLSKTYSLWYRGRYMTIRREKTDRGSYYRPVQVLQLRYGRSRHVERHVQHADHLPPAAYSRVTLAFCGACSWRRDGNIRRPASMSSTSTSQRGKFKPRRTWNPHS